MGCCAGPWEKPGKKLSFIVYIGYLYAYKYPYLIFLLTYTNYR